MSAWVPLAALLLFLGVRITTTAPTRHRRKAAVVPNCVLYLLIWELLHPWSRHPTPLTESQDRDATQKISIVYGTEGFQKNYISLLELIKAARKLRLLREGVHPNPGPPTAHRPRSGHGPKGVQPNTGPPVQSHPKKGREHRGAINTAKSKNPKKGKQANMKDLKLASYNLGFSIEDRLVRESLEDALDHEGVDIAALQEVATGKLKLRNHAFDGEKYAFYISKGNAACKPVGFAVKRSLIEKFGSPTIDCFGPRIALLRWRRLSVHLLCGYAPVRSRTRVDEESPAGEERQMFWNQLRAVYADSKRENATTFVAGDFNAEISRGDNDEDVLTVPEHNADSLCELIRIHQLSVGNWKAPQTDPECYTFLGTGMAPPALLDYILVPEARFNHVVAFYAVDKNAYLKKHTNHKLLVLRINVFPKRKDKKDKRGREETLVLEPHFTDTKSTPVDDKYARFAAKVHGLHKQGIIEVMPTLDHEFISDRTRDLIAQLELARADKPALVTVLDELDLHIKQSRREDKNRATREFAQQISEKFDSPDRADVYRMLNHLTRASGCLKTHVRDHAKLELLDHYMKLLGTEPVTPDFRRLDEGLEPVVLPKAIPQHGPTLVLFTDGSFFDSRGLAGWSFVDVTKNFARCGSLPSPDEYMTVDTRMTKAEFHCAFAEAYAILEGLRAHTDYNICFNVDSQSTIDTFNALNHLQQSDFRDIPFAHVWKEIFVLSRNRAVHCEKVSAHSNVEYNEQADVLAKFGACLPPGKARSIQCPNDHWWARMNSHLTTMSDGTHSGLVQAWNAEIYSWPHSDAVSLLPPRHTRILKPLAANDEAPTRREVRHAIASLSNVTPGADGIVMRMCKNEEMFEDIYLLLVEIWDTGIVPRDWRTSIMVSLKKCPHQALGPENCRGISLTSIPSRILTRIIMERAAGADIRAEQIGFRRAQGAPQAQLIVRQAVRAANAGQTPLILTFVDLVKAFDQLDRRKLPEVLTRYGYGKKATQLMLNMWDDEVVLKYPDKTFSKSFRTKRGTKQGDVCSPFIFNLYMDLAIRDALPRLSGATFVSASGEDVLKLIMYADDIVLFASSAEAASQNLALLEAALEPTGLKINILKTKSLHAASTTSPRPDTHTGYANRIRKKGLHKDQHPEAEQSKITYTNLSEKVVGTLEIRIECDKTRCPHEHCPFVATHSSFENLRCLRDHLKSRHHVDHVVIRPALKEISGHSDPDPIPHPDIAPSLARRPNGYMSYVHLNNKYVERVLHFRYLGSMISEDGSLTAEISQRIGAAGKAFHKLPRELWTSEDMPLYVKWELYKHLVLSRLLYGAEAWTPTETDVHHIESVYIKHLRVLTGLTTVFVAQEDGTSTGTTPSRAKISAAMDEPRLEDVLRTYRLRLYGQLKRAGPFSFLHKWACLEAKSTETAPRGLQRESWHVMSSSDLFKMNIVDTTPCYNREKWKEVTAYFPRGPKKPQFEQGAWD